MKEKYKEQNKAVFMFDAFTNSNAFVSVSPVKYILRERRGVHSFFGTLLQCH